LLTEFANAETGVLYRNREKDFTRKQMTPDGGTPLGSILTGRLGWGAGAFRLYNYVAQICRNFTLTFRAMETGNRSCDASFLTRIKANHCAIGLADKHKEITSMPTKTASTRCSDYGMICVQCDDLLIAPEWSCYEDDRHVLNLWSCTRCGCHFEIETVVPANSKSVNDEVRIKAFFPSLLVA
jgi:hypothetical protein